MGECTNQLAEHCLLCTKLELAWQNRRAQDNCENTDERAARHAHVHILGHYFMPPSSAS